MKITPLDKAILQAVAVAAQKAVNSNKTIQWHLMDDYTLREIAFITTRFADLMEARVNK